MNVAATGCIREWMQPLIDAIEHMDKITAPVYHRR